MRPVPPGATRSACLLVLLAAVACSGTRGAQLLTQLRTSNLTITDREVIIGGEWATEIAGFEWTLVPLAGGPATTERGNYVQVWHHEPDGRWLFARELWNSSAPPVTPSKGP